MIGRLYASAYALATDFAGPALRLLLARRGSRGKEDRARIGERMGRPGKPRPAGPLVWVHGASVGEALSALPLIGRLLDTRPDLQILVTTGTVTSAAMMAERLPPRAFHQFVPLDRRPWAASFLDHWRPDLALWLESELWPNLLVAARARTIPLVLVNARLSARSFARWRVASGFARWLLGHFSICLAQSETDATRLRALRAPNVSCPGNLKRAAPPLAADEAELKRLRAAVGTRPVWLAASTHAGEEAIAARVHRALAAKHPRLLTIIVPRHPARGLAIARDLAGDGLKIARRAAGEPIAPDTDIYLADTMGELGLFYRLAPVAFVGGSLVPHGGQNPLEPAQLGAAILHGPHVANFRDIAAALGASGAAEPVADEAALTAALGRLLADPAEVARRGEAGRSAAAAETQVLDRIMTALAPLLAGLPAAPTAAPDAPPPHRARA